MAPTWMNKLVRKKEKRPAEEMIDQKRLKDEDKARKVLNSGVREELKLKQDEQYGMIFHPGNIKNLEKPEKSSGNPICLRYY